jgi:hypothetical protein
VSLKAANIGEVDDVPEVGRLHRAMGGRVYLQ